MRRVEQHLPLPTELARKISESLPTGAVNAMEISKVSKTAFKAVCLRELLVHRVSDLATVSCRGLSQGDIIPGFILARSTMETVAVAIYLADHVTSVVETGRLGNVDEVLNRLLVGSRNDGPVQSVNILTMVDHAARCIPTFRACYDELSEILHPNYAGLLASYGILRPDERSVILGRRQDDSPPLSFASHALTISLQAFIECHGRLGKIVPEFVAICERDALRE